MKELADRFGYFYAIGYFYTFTQQGTVINFLLNKPWANESPSLWKYFGNI